MSDGAGLVNSFHYSVFGLKVRSSLPLPELFPASADGRPDVTIDTAAIPIRSSGPGLTAVNGALLLVIPEVGRFMISGGNAITVEAERDAPEKNVRLYLLGSAFGALVHQRRLLPLHANGIEINGKAFAFLGPSGAGKSTLAAWFHAQGRRVIADDVCVVGFDEEGFPYAAPGLPRLRLWAEVLELMGREADPYPRSYAGDEDYDKFDVPIELGGAAISNMPLSALYLLDRCDAFSITELRGVEAADAIFAHTYRGAFVSVASGSESHWRSSINLVRNIPVFRLSRQWGLDLLDAQCRQICDHASALGALQMAGAG